MVRQAFLAGAALALVSLPVSVTAQKLAGPSSGQKLQTATMNDVPHCVRKLGTVSVENGDNVYGWQQYHLAGPEKLIKVMVQRSGCFNLVDRGAGLNAAERERALGGGIGLQRGSNVGMGQVKAADYVLVAEVQGANSNTSGSAVGAGLGGLVGHGLGGVLGGIRTQKLEANTVLSLTNVRTTETVAVQDGYAAKNNISFAGGAGGWWGGGAAALVGGGYDNTDIGRIVTLAFIQAYSKMVTDLGLLTPGSEGTAEASPTKTFTALAAVAMRQSAAAAAKIIRTLPAGSVVYPTGKKAGLWWEVADENDNVGWVLNTKLEPTK
jgi:curli biogenesis system outer membrane secretion channel CsgG